MSAKTIAVPPKKAAAAKPPKAPKEAKAPKAAKAAAPETQLAVKEQTPPTQVMSARRVTQIEKQVKTKFLAEEAKLRNAAEEAIGIGKLLIEAKQNMPHGEFGKWCEERIGKSEWVCQQRIRIYEKFGQTELEGANVSPAVLGVLASGKVSEETRQEVLAELQQGGNLSVTDVKSRVGMGTGAPAPTGDDNSADFDETAPADDEGAGGGGNTATETQSGTSTGGASTGAGSGGSAGAGSTGAGKGKAKGTGTEIYNSIGGQDESDLTDEEWLNQLPLYLVLKSKAGKGVNARTALLDYRTIQGPLEKFAKELKRCKTVQHPEETGFSAVFSRVASFPHPKNWKLHAPCAGDGCKKCGFGGYDVTGAGIDPSTVPVAIETVSEIKEVSVEAEPAPAAEEPAVVETVLADEAPLDYTELAEESADLVEAADPVPAPVQPEAAEAKAAPQTQSIDEAAELTEEYTEDSYAPVGAIG
jgi:hypothetical protein